MGLDSPLLMAAALLLLHFVVASLNRFVKRKVSIRAELDQLLGTAKRAYDPATFKHYLTDLTETPLDQTMTKLCRRFRAAPPNLRSEIARRVRAFGMEERWSFHVFSRREAVRAEREGSAERLRDGLAALVLEDNMEYRDTCLTLQLLYHCARRIGADPGPLFREAAEAASPEMAATLAGHADVDPSRLSALFYVFTEVQTDQGVGYVHST